MFLFSTFRIRYGKGQSTITDDQSLTGNNEDSTLKTHLKQINDDKL